MADKKEKLSKEQVAELYRLKHYLKWSDSDAIRFHVYHRLNAMPIDALVAAFERQLDHAIDTTWGGWFDDACHEWCKKHGKPELDDVKRLLPEPAAFGESDSF